MNVVAFVFAGVWSFWLDTPVLCELSFWGLWKSCVLVVHYSYPLLRLCYIVQITSFDI